MTDSDHGPQPAPQDPAASGDVSNSAIADAKEEAVESSPVAEPPAKEHIAMFVGVLAAVGVAYYWSVLSLIEVWEENPNYSHGYVVPFFALGLAWVAYTRTNVLPVVDQVSRKETIRGGVEIAIGFGFHLAGMMSMIDFFEFVGLIFILLGVLLAFGGEKANRAYAESATAVPCDPSPSASSDARR